WRFTRRMGRNTSALARRYAPVGQGTLRRGIQDPEMTGLPRSSHARIVSRARHTLYVHEGTTGPIRRPNGGVMPIRNVHARGHIVAYRRTVRGQRANPFLARA